MLEPVFQHILQYVITVGKVSLETITGDDTLNVEISKQYCDDNGSCTDASVVVAVDKGLQNSTFSEIISTLLESLQSGGSVLQKMNLLNVPKSNGQFVPN